MPYSDQCMQLLRQLCGPSILVNTFYLNRVQPTYAAEWQITKAAKPHSSKDKAADLPTLWAIPIVENGQTIIRYRFTYSKPIYQLLKSLRFISWNTNYHSFVGENQSEHFKQLIESLRGTAILAFRNDYQIKDMELLQAYQAQWQSSNQQRSCQLAFLHWMQAQNYSISTLTTYKKTIERFLNTSPYEALNESEVTAAQINQYHEDWTSQGASSTSIHQSVNGLRLYFTYLQGQKMDLREINRPKIRNGAPKSIDKRRDKGTAKSQPG